MNRINVNYLSHEIGGIILLRSIHSEKNHFGFSSMSCRPPVKMAGRLLTLILLVTSSLQTKSVTTFSGRFSNTSLPLSDISSTSTVKEHCKCWMCQLNTLTAVVHSLYSDQVRASGAFGVPRQCITPQLTL